MPNHYVIENWSYPRSWQSKIIRPSLAWELRQVY